MAHGAIATPAAAVDGVGVGCDGGVDGADGGSGGLTILNACAVEMTSVMSTAVAIALAIACDSSYTSAPWCTS